MEHAFAVAFLRPFLLLALFAAVVIPAELLPMRLWPEGRLKRLLCDRDLAGRRPKLFWGVYIVLVVSLYASIAAFS
jgi:hypothetical protein